MERLKHIKEVLFSRIDSEVGKGLDNLDTKELGEAIDMIKDMSEAMYYCSVVKAMEEKEEEEKFKNKYYTPMYNFPPIYYNNDRMYYNGNNGQDGSNSGGQGSRYYDGGNGQHRMYYDEGEHGRRYHGGAYRDGMYGKELGEFYEDNYPYPFEIRDYREGKSPLSRKNYMESKELKHDKSKQMKELDKYAQELTEDIMEMIHDATPEEKMALSQKISTLATKIK